MLHRTFASFLVVVMLLISTLTADASGGKAENGVNYYESPCYHRERVARGIPYQNDAYLAWARSHMGTPAWDDWNAAALACFRDHPVAKFDWDNMIKVSR